MKKKGFMGELGVIMVMLFIFGIVFTIIFFTNNTMNNAFQNMSNIPDVSKNMMGNYNDRLVNVLDGMYLFLFIGFFIALILTAFALRSHPVFMMMGVLMLIVLGGLTFHFANAYNSVATSSALVSTANQFNAIPFILNNYPIVFIIISFVFLIVLFAKNDSGGINI